MIAVEHAEAIEAYTHESQLYANLNRICHEESEKQFQVFMDYLYHLEQAASSLPNFVGSCFRGLKHRVNPSAYKEGTAITWQAPSSSSRKVTVLIDFIGNNGESLWGSFFKCHSKSGKRLDHISVFPHEEEVLFQINSHFKVLKVVQTEKEKQNELPELAQYDLKNLDVYVLEQL